MCNITNFIQLLLFCWFHINNFPYIHVYISIIMDMYIVIRRWQWHPTPVLLPGKFHGWRSLVGCSWWGSKESDLTEQLHFHISLLCIGEGNGNPPQCSNLENPRDGIAQSWTLLKWLSSSSILLLGFPSSSDNKESACSARDLGLIHESGSLMLEVWCFDHLHLILSSPIFPPQISFSEGFFVFES